MEANEFVAEVYRRMSLRHAESQVNSTWDQIKDDPVVVLAANQYESVLPTRKDAEILDVGFGRGWFLAACVKLGYTNVSGADFGIGRKQYIKDWSPSITALHDIETNIADLLVKYPNHFDFIHLSHVIEHVPKYSLFYMVDALYLALKEGGTLFLRTPNMEGPTPTSSYFVTLAHEYGFSGSNLTSLLSICNFEDIKFHRFRLFHPSIKQRLGMVLRWPITDTDYES